MKAGDRPGVLVEALGDELDVLLAPVSVETFVKEYWGKKALFVKGHPGKYKGFFDAAALSRALSAPGAFPKESLHASFDKKTGVRASGGGRADAPTEVFAATSDQAPALLRGGATLCITELELRVPELCRFLGSVKRRLGYPGKVSFNSYLSPPGAGFNWHFDKRIASSMQIEGSKWWRYSNRPLDVAWPRSNGLLRPDGLAQFSDSTVGLEPWERLSKFDDGDVTEVLLEPGDLLVIPAGTWHDARAGEGNSLALNLTFNPISCTDIVTALLDSVLVSDSEWRAAPPMLPAGEPGGIDPECLEALTARLEEAAARLKALRPDSVEVARVWAKLVQKADCREVDAARAKAGPPAALEASDELRPVRNSGLYASNVAGGGLLLAIGSARIELGGTAAMLARRAIASSGFRGADCVTWVPATPLTWEIVKPLLQTLVRDGILERV